MKRVAHGRRHCLGILCIHLVHLHETQFDEFIIIIIISLVTYVQQPVKVDAILVNPVQVNGKVAVVRATFPPIGAERTVCE